MQVLTLSPRGFGANTYVLTSDGKTAIVVDPAQPRVESELLRRGLRATCVLLTHCHFDHVGGVAALQEGGAKVYCSAAEKPLVGTQADLFEYFGAPRSPYRIDETFEDGEEKAFGDFSVRALWTPGHTKGSCAYLVTAKDGGRVLFTGDTLFQGSVGRTDFPTGNLGELRASLKRIVDLEGDLPIYSGHGDATTLEEERRGNPFLKDL